MDYEEYRRDMDADEEYESLLRSLEIQADRVDRLLEALAHPHTILE